MKICLLIAAIVLLPAAAAERPLTVQSAPVHLRSGEQREWTSFPQTAAGASVALTFESSARNSREFSLVLRQRDVKSTTWAVALNEHQLGALIADERDIVRVLPIPAGVLVAGSNTLQVTGSAGRLSDDIEVRDVRIEPVPVADLLQEASVEVRVTAERGSLPVRITVVDSSGSLVPFSPLRKDAREAVRTGVIYTADGNTRIGLPAGEYRVYASRGFEYGAPSKRVRLRTGESESVALRIRREVHMPGFISCDTHVHTLELSGHGDASVKERVLTAAGEGLDLMVATEHNRLADYDGVLQKLHLNGLVTSVRGSEVTTSIGHFNVFPLHSGATHPDFRERDWAALMDGIWKTPGARVVVQNHPRDLHSGYRPFDPAHHLSSTGENRNGRPFRANAMEVVNSGAMYSDPLQLVRDWMGLLTRGIQVAAVGASDTHTVDFVPIAQARTYVDVSAVPGDWRENVELTIQQLAEGKNLVSYGLAADLRVSGSPRNGTVPVELMVWGPSWSAADRLTVYSNGVQVWQKTLDGTRRPGRKFSEVVDVPVPRHDAALVAVATGPGILEPFWEVRKPYQPVSPEWHPIVLGVSRAVWIDGDANGKVEAPLDYAQRLVEKSDADLGAWDASVREHVATLRGKRAK